MIEHRCLECPLNMRCPDVPELMAACLEMRERERDHEGAADVPEVPAAVCRRAPTSFIVRIARRG